MSARRSQTPRPLRRPRPPRPLAGAVEAFAARVAPATALADVQRVWADVVGAAVAAEAAPVAERAGVLQVRCRAAAWAHELELLGPELAGRLNAAIGRDAVRSLRCRSNAG